MPPSPPTAIDAYHIKAKRSHAKAATLPRIALLYSGRWFGSGNQEIGWAVTKRWVENHLTHVIQPNNASVFMVVSSSNWCGPPAGAIGASTSHAEERER